MGGRGQNGTLAKPNGQRGGKKQKAMTEEEYLASKGVSEATSGWVIDKLRGNKTIATKRGRERFEKERAKAESEYQEKREQAKEEYRQMVANGEVRDKTKLERALERANGNPDLESTQASRRIVEKMGYDWQTGKPLAKARQIEKWDYRGEKERVDKLINAIDTTNGVSALRNLSVSLMKEDAQISNLIKEVESGAENGDVNALMTMRRRIRTARQKVQRKAGM